MQLRRTKHSFEDELGETYLTPVTLRRRHRIFKTSFVVVFGDLLSGSTSESSYVVMRVMDDCGIVRHMTAYDIEMSTSPS